jgi:hypothetical protein
MEICRVTFICAMSLYLDDTGPCGLRTPVLHFFCGKHHGGDWSAEAVNFVEAKKAGGIEIRLPSEHQNYNLRNVHITIATLIKFTQKIVY